MARFAAAIAPIMQPFFQPPRAKTTHSKLVLSLAKDHKASMSILWMDTIPRRGLCRLIGAALWVSAFSTSALAAPDPATVDQEMQAVSADEFLSSLGICIHMAQGVQLSTYIAPLRYLGLRNVRDDFGPAKGYVALHQMTGVQVNLIASAHNLDDDISELRRLADANALLSIEGPNEPNNFPITYLGHKGGGSGRGADWNAVAFFQRDLYARAKSDATLSRFPIFDASEVGAENPNVGLQFLTIPQGAGTVFPPGTRFADYANVHNYVSSNAVQYVDNQAWNAADPTLSMAWDGLYGEYGKLWGNHFAGYSNAQLGSLPRVTTETGWDSKSGIGGERIQGVALLNTYLAQFKQGWRYTFVYMLRDGEGGNGNQGVFNADSKPKLAAVYIHNLTTILADTKFAGRPSALRVSLSSTPPTLHTLLLRKSDGSFYLVLWNERVTGTDHITVGFDHVSAPLRVFDPTLGSAPLRVVPQATVALEMTDHPLIVEVQSR